MKVDVKLSVDVDGGTEGTKDGGQRGLMVGDGRVDGGGEVMSIFNISCKEKKQKKNF